MKLRFVLRNVMIITILIVMLVPNMIINISYATTGYLDYLDQEEEEATGIETYLRDIVVGIKGRTVEMVDGTTIPIKGVSVTDDCQTDSEGRFEIREPGKQYIRFRFGRIDNASEENDAPLSHVLQYNGHDYYVYRGFVYFPLQESPSSNYYTYKNENPHEEKDIQDVDAKPYSWFRTNFYYNEDKDLPIGMKVSNNTALFEALDILRESEKKTNQKYYSLDEFKQKATDLTVEEREDVAERLEMLSKKVWTQATIGDIIVKEEENPIENIDFNTPVIISSPAQDGVQRKTVRTYSLDPDFLDRIEPWSGGSSTVAQYAYIVKDENYVITTPTDNILMQPDETIDMFEFQDRMVAELYRGVDSAPDQKAKLQENSRRVTEAVKQIAQNMSYDEKAILYCILVDGGFCNNNNIVDGVDVRVEEVFGIEKYGKEWNDLDTYATANYAYGYYKQVTYKPTPTEVLESVTQMRYAFRYIMLSINITLDKKESFTLYTVSKATGLRVTLNTGKVLSQIERDFNDPNDPLDQKVLLEVLDDDIAHGATIEIEYTVQVINDSQCTCTHLELIDYLPVGFHYSSDTKLITSNGTNAIYGWNRNSLETLHEKGHVSDKTFEKFEGQNVATIYLDNENMHGKGFYIPSEGTYTAKIVVSRVIGSAEDLQSVIDNYVEILGYKGGVISGEKADGSYETYEERRMTTIYKEDGDYSKFIGLYPGDTKDDYVLGNVLLAEMDKNISSGLDYSKNSNLVMVVPPTGSKVNTLEMIINTIKTLVIKIMVL